MAANMSGCSHQYAGNSVRETGERMTVHQQALSELEETGGLTRRGSHRAEISRHMRQALDERCPTGFLLLRHIGACHVSVARGRKADEARQERWYDPDDGRDDLFPWIEVVRSVLRCTEGEAKGRG